ncbi:MAG: ABC transporter permease [Anaerolineae bacterium]|nr:ABC transporter permease [Thermoflexales bacterium]MDW8407248.1 ABC transporter permease [Anaerolineae bacterium]
MAVMRRRDVLITTLIFLLIWQVLAGVIRRDILPAPTQVVEAMATYAGELGRHALASALRVVVSILIAVVLAVPAGLAMGQMPRLNRLFAPLVYLVYPIPKIVFFPIILLFAGAGDVSKVLIIVLILFFQILVPVRDDAIGLRPELLNSVKSLGAGRRALFRFVYVPASLPAVLTALRLSIGTAIAVLYLTETTATLHGLGYFIYYTASTLFDYAATYAGAVVMGLLGLGLYFLIDGLERRLCPWKFAA